MSNFKLGGTVQLNSGGPPMTVKVVEGDWVTCGRSLSASPRRSSSAYPRFQTWPVRAAFLLGRENATIPQLAIRPRNTIVTVDSGYPLAPISSQ